MDVGAEAGAGEEQPPPSQELGQVGEQLFLAKRHWLYWDTLWKGLGELLRDPQTLDPPALQELEQTLLFAQFKLGGGGAAAFAPLLPPPKDPTPLLSLLLPELERRLIQKVSDLTDYFKGGTPQETPPKHPAGSPPDPQDPPQAPPNPPGGVNEEIWAERGRLERARRHQRELGGLLGGLQRVYPQVLLRCRELLEALGGRGLAGRWAELERRHAHYLKAKGVAVLMKARLEELKLLLDTYPPPTVQAHRSIRAGLEGEISQLKAKLGELGAAVAAYEGLGPAMVELAREYQQLQLQLGERDWALRQLRPPVTSP